MLRDLFPPPQQYVCGSPKHEKKIGFFLVCATNHTHTHTHTHTSTFMIHARRAAALRGSLLSPPPNPRISKNPLVELSIRVAEEERLALMCGERREKDTIWIPFHCSLSSSSRADLGISIANEIEKGAPASLSITHFGFLLLLPTLLFSSCWRHQVWRSTFNGFPVL